MKNERTRNPQPREVLPWKLGSIGELRQQIKRAATKLAPLPYTYGRHYASRPQAHD